MSYGPQPGDDYDEGPNDDGEGYYLDGPFAGLPRMRTRPTIHESGLTMAQLHAHQRARALPTVTEQVDAHVAIAERAATSQWLSWAIKHDLSHSRGNGPFGPGGPHGVVLHVNDSPIGSSGTSAAWYIAGGGVDSVCPTFQVMRDGTTYQFLPLNWQPWTQASGNYWGPSIETGGNHAEPLQPAQLAACAKIMAAAHDVLGVPLQVTDSVSGRGLGTHQMGGSSWGGHPCPGVLRMNQRPAILSAAQPAPAKPVKYGPTDPKWSDTMTQDELIAAIETALSRHEIRVDYDDPKSPRVPMDRMLSATNEHVNAVNERLVKLGAK